jgi:hypothetical protein
MIAPGAIVRGAQATPFRNRRDLRRWGRRSWGQSPVNGMQETSTTRARRVPARKWRGYTEMRTDPVADWGPRGLRRNRMRGFLWIGMPFGLTRTAIAVQT